MEVKKFEDWILFEDKVFLSLSWKLLKDKINLLPTIQKAIQKKKPVEFVVDYPWEYEKYNIYIKAIEGQTNRLNFFITDYNNNEYYAFIQDPSVLENLDLVSYPAKWYFTNKIIEEQIEKLWFEWETYLI